MYQACYQQPRPSRKTRPGPEQLRGMPHLLQCGPEDGLWIPDEHGVVRSFVCPAGAGARSVAEVVVRREGDMEGGGSEPCDGEAVVGHRGGEGGDDRVV